MSASASLAYREFRIGGACVERAMECHLGGEAEDVFAKKTLVT